MTEKNWRFISKQPVHEGFVRLSEHQVELPQGERIVYEVDESAPFAVAVLGGRTTLFMSSSVAR